MAAGPAPGPARQQMALLGLVLWFGHHPHGGGVNHGS